MSGPAVGERDAARTELTVEEMEALSRQQQAPDLTKIELQNTGLGTFKGKTAAELLAHAKALEDSLQISERARLSAEQIAAIAAKQPSPVAPTPAPVAEKLPTDEEIAAMYETDPLKAIKVMTERATKLAAESFQSRLQPLIQSTAASAETQARAKYPEEFAVLGDVIQDAIKQIPNSRQALTNPEVWDDLIAWARGRQGSFERLLEARSAKTRETAAATAQATQQANVGFQPAPSGRQGIYKSDGSPDPVAAEIAEKTGLTWDEYVKWSKVG